MKPKKAYIKAIETSLPQPVREVLTAQAAEIHHSYEYVKSALLRTGANGRLRLPAKRTSAASRPKLVWEICAAKLPQRRIGARQVGPSVKGAWATRPKMNTVSTCPPRGILAACLHGVYASPASRFCVLLPLPFAFTGQALAASAPASNTLVIDNLGKGAVPLDGPWPISTLATTPPGHREATTTRSGNSLRPNKAGARKPTQATPALPGIAAP